jgi:hypothetical protein
MVHVSAPMEVAGVCVTEMFPLTQGADGVTERPLAICLVIDGAAGQNLQRGRSRTDQPVAQKVHLVLVELV